MEGIEVVETEWSGELHRHLICEKHAACLAWRDSPEAREHARRMKEAKPLVWGRVIFPTGPKKTPIYRW